MQEMDPVGRKAPKIRVVLLLVLLTAVRPSGSGESLLPGAKAPGALAPGFPVFQDPLASTATSSALSSASNL